MGRMKHIYEQIVEDIAWGRIPNPAKAPTPKPSPNPETQTLHVLTCDGKPLAAYKHLAVAEYEMWLCRKGEESMGNVPNNYEITAVPVCVYSAPTQWCEV